MDDRAMEPVAAARGPVVPEGTRLLHIGPHKTATTALQAALWFARDDLLLQGVRHAGRSRNPSTAVRAVTRRGSGYSDRPPAIRHWHALVREIRGSREPRLVVSSEFLATASPDVIRRIVDELDPRRVQIVVTVRPLARIIPSFWQQDVQGGSVESLDAWIQSLLTGRKARPDAGFWWLQRHDRLIERWVEAVGPERVTAVVVDDRDHGFVLRAFEGLLGVRDDTLRPVHDLANRSLTADEAEAIRAFNIAFRGAGGSRAVHAVVMRLGAAQQMKRREPSPEEPRVLLPSWALEPVARISNEIADGVVASGVRIIGDPGLLRAVPDAGEIAPGSAPGIPPSVAAMMAVGILVSTGAARTRAATPSGADVDSDVIARVPTYQVGGTIAVRVALAATSAWHAAPRAIRRWAAGGVDAEADPVGRRLAPAEAAAIRAFSDAYQAAGLDPAQLGRMVEAAARHLRRSEPPDVPAGATAKQQEPGAEPRLGDESEPSAVIPPAVAASVAMGILAEQGLLPEPRPREPGRGRLAWGPAPNAWLRAEPVEIVGVRSSRLVAELAGRLRPGSASRGRRRDGGLAED